MSDIVKRLQDAASAEGWISDAETYRVQIEAADEIEQLRADNARLRAEMEQYENVIIPSWKREEEMWRQDEANAVEFRRVLADELDKRDATIAQLRAWLREWCACATNSGSGEAIAKVEQQFVQQCRDTLLRLADSATHRENERE